MQRHNPWSIASIRFIQSFVMGALRNNAGNRLDRIRMLLHEHALDSEKIPREKNQYELITPVGQ